MANALYPKFKEALLAGDIDIPEDSVRAVLIDVSEYTFSATHDALNDVSAGARISGPQPLASKTILNGTLDAANLTFPAVPGGAVVGAVIIYVDTGTESTSPLIAYIDTGSNLPITPNGGDINLNWSESGIFSL
ncbi:hypothetical protein FPY71_09990 [Aureimonas fodinaquatilis]|uniref:Uncharacterized protein n=1 Tax=Aureimonas fodinaquatilis TaxID=2565783 RepID=A0A5B0DWC2_9HYPH|nr:hypothetical protein [Aureimonas fodinaquatilis]KAA0970796.1 hypothetical protein FPY71_09990 [Aureimonas fodinaquatilis]